jgi:tetratricopeptide (TPR) repeat protein
VETAFALDNLASIIAEEGLFLEAQNLYGRALGILEKELGTENETSVRVMIHLASVYAQTGQYSQARALLSKGLAASTKLVTKDAILAEMLDGIGTIDALQGSYPEAQNLFGRALQILQTTRATFKPRLGTRNERMALILIDLAGATAQLGQYAEAVDEAERARNLLAALSDPPPRPMIKVLTILGDL